MFIVSLSKNETFFSNNYSIFFKSVVSHFVSSGCSEERSSFYFDIRCTLVTSHEHEWTPGLHCSDDGVLKQDSQKCTVLDS